jgi:hypothetical protein
MLQMDREFESKIVFPNGLQKESVLKGGIGLGVLYGCKEIENEEAFKKFDLFGISSVAIRK